MNVGYVLPNSVINYPSLDYPFTRAVEYKHFLHQTSHHSVVFYEHSTDHGDPYYPVPNSRNQRLYEKYANISRTVTHSKVTFVGRLANYKYFNMDQAIRNALNVFHDYLQKPKLVPDVIKKTVRSQQSFQKVKYINNFDLIQLYEHVIHNVSYIDEFVYSFEIYVKQLIESQYCEPYQNQTVLVSMSNINYESCFVNFKKQYTYHNIQCVILLSMDKESFEKIVNLDIPTLYFPTNEMKTNQHVGIAKAIISYCVVKLGYNILFSEMDIFWSKSPLNYVNSEFDHFYYVHSYSEEINLGLYYSVSNLKSKIFNKKIIMWMLEFHHLVPWDIAGDQKIFDFALRGTSYFIPKHFYYKQQNWIRLPHSLFWHNMGDNWMLESNHSRITYHLSFGLGDASNRIKAAKQIGVWYDN